MATSRLLIAVTMVISWTVVLSTDSDSTMFGYIVDEWGSINLPFSTGYCQHTFPVDEYVMFTCYNNETVYSRKTYDDSICYHGVECNGPKDNSSDCNVRYWWVDNTDNETWPTCANGTVSTSVIDIKAFCDFDPVARRELYLTGDECFFLGNVTDDDDGTDTLYYAQLTCNGTDFVTTLFDDDECSESSQVISRSISGASDECAVWLFDGNETNFGFDITAKVESCESAANTPFGADTGMIGLVLFCIAFLWR